MLAQASLGSCTAISDNLPTTYLADTMNLYPYLTNNGLYGYADGQLELHIPAQYKSASTFSSTGFAVVADEHHQYGVIDRKGGIVVPLRHKTARLQVVGDHTLVWTERGYTNRFRFWEWKFWPGFWSPSDKRLFDTEVERSHLVITVLETEQKIYSERISSNQAYHRYLGIEPLNETHFVWDGMLYGWDAKRYKVLARHIFGKVDDGLLLQRNGAHYRLLNREGKPANKSRFRYQDSLRYAIGGKDHRKNLIVQDDYRRRVAKVFSDENGKQYVFPDFDKPFPADVALQVHNSLAADTLISKAALISSIPGTDRFIFRWRNQEADTFEHWMLNTAGNWHGDVPEGNSFFITTPAGQILWPPIHTVVPADSVEQGWRLSNYRKAGADSALFEVTIRREKEERMGVWDADGKQWAWKPLNASVRCLDLEKGYWTFKPEKEGKYGLYHLPTQRELIAPKYHDMNESGMVSYNDVKRDYIRFYIDWDTQIEYREH